jgi:hypothetical protein
MERYHYLIGKIPRTDAGIGGVYFIFFSLFLLIFLSLSKQTCNGFTVKINDKKIYDALVNFLTMPSKSVVYPNYLKSLIYKLE